MGAARRRGATTPTSCVTRRRLPPALPAAAAAVPRPATHRAQHPQRRRSRAIRVETYFAVTRTPCSSARRRSSSSASALQRRGPYRLRRAVPVLAVLLHHRRSPPRVAEGVRRRPVRHPAALHARGPVAVARDGTGSISLLFWDRRRLRRDLGRQAGHPLRRSRCFRCSSPSCQGRELARCARWRERSSSRCASSTPNATSVLHPSGR